jgi:hypothetical protein
MNRALIKIGPPGQEALFEGLNCKECSVRWYMPADYVEAKRKSGDVFFCPNGHRKQLTPNTPNPFDKRPPTPQLPASGGRPVNQQQPLPSSNPPQPIETRQTSELQINPQFGTE